MLRSTTAGTEATMVVERLRSFVGSWNGSYLGTIRRDLLRVHMHRTYVLRRARSTQGR